MYNIYFLILISHLFVDYIKILLRFIVELIYFNTIFFNLKKILNIEVGVGFLEDPFLPI